MNQSLNVLPLVSDDFHSDQVGNDCLRKLQSHCIQIMHSDIYSLVENHRYVSKLLGICNFFIVLQKVYLKQSLVTFVRAN